MILLAAVAFAVWVPAAVPDDPALALIRQARIALGRGDRATASLCLRGWAGLEKRRELPAGLEALAAEAIQFREARGGIEVYTSRLSDRLRVGVADPAGIVGQVQAFGQAEGGKPVQLGQLEPEQPDRIELRLPERASDVTLIVDLHGRGCGPELLLRRLILLPSRPPLPGAPDPIKSAARIDPRPPPLQAPIIESPPLLPWWLITGGVLAAGLVGAALWQETR